MTDRTLSDARQNAINLAQSQGWEARRFGKKWEFRQPDTGGLWDVFSISHRHLSVHTLMTKLESYNPPLGKAVREAREAAQTEWLRKIRGGSQKYTVLLELPDDLANDESCAADTVRRIWVEARDVDDAIDIASIQAKNLTEYDGSSDDFATLAVYEGHLFDLHQS